MEFRVFSTNNNFSRFVDARPSNDLVLGGLYQGLEDHKYLKAGLRPSGLPGEQTENLLMLLVDPVEPDETGASHKIAAGLVLTLSDDGEIETGHKNWISSVSVHPDYRGHKLSRALITLFFEYARVYGVRDIKQSSYTKDGVERLLPIFDELAPQYPDVEFHDYRKVFHYEVCEH